MAEVSIRAYTRRGKNGKTVQVRGYTRRVGRKGIHSPKLKKTSPGEELTIKLEEKKSAPKMSPKELVAERKRIQEWENNLKRAEAERKSLGLSPSEYSRRKVAEEKGEKPATKNRVVSRPLSKKGSKGIFRKIEDEIVAFISKYGRGRKYKKQL